MSMPNFPEETLAITCEQAFNLLLGSIAMEELALSHILNAEGEKLQYVLGTLPGRPCTCASPKEVLEVNRSISDLLERVAYNQILLKGKLQQVLEAKAECTPPPSPPCPCGVCGYAAEPGRVWHCGRPLPWRHTGGSGLCWQGCSPALLHLCRGRSVMVCLSLRLCAEPDARVAVALRGERGELLWAGEGTCCRPGESVVLCGCVVLPAGSTATLQCVLCAPDAVTVQQGGLTLTALDCQPGA